jgi:hypothetical protein
MKVTAITMVGAALAAGIFATPAYADDPAAPSTPAVSPTDGAGAGVQGPTENYVINFGGLIPPDTPATADAEESDEMVLFWW